MGYLRDVRSKQGCQLEAEHTIGRSPTSMLVVEHPLVSSQHAALRWTGEGWELRDLASRNGTWVDGTRIGGVPMALPRGAVLTFGAPDNAWELVDDRGPQAMLLPSDGGIPWILDRDLIALPSAEDPSATVFRDADGAWWLEATDQPLRAISNGEQLEIDGRSFRFSNPAPPARTAGSEGGDSHADSPKLLFAVSADEEHVELAAELGREQVDLGANARFYVLLTLARQRLADRRNLLPETSCGWIHVDDLLQGLRINQQQLNVDVFRIRKQLADKGVPFAATVIERRAHARQIRIGFSQLSIRAL